MDRDRVDLLDDLQRQLAGWRHNERAGGAPWTRDQLVKDWKGECGCLAAPRGGASEEILALHGRRDGVGLDWRRTREAQLLDSLEEARVELEF